MDYVKRCGIVGLISVMRLYFPVYHTTNANTCERFEEVLAKTVSQKSLSIRRTCVISFQTLVTRLFTEPSTVIDCSDNFHMGLRL